MERRLLVHLLIPAASLLASCGGQDTNGPGGAGGSGPPPTVNDCTEFTAATEVVFTSIEYKPKCAKIGQGGTITFKGNFGAHPLQGGTASDDGTETPDEASPIPATKSGTSVDVTFPNAGVFGFYCTAHGKVGMRGAVLVE